MGALGALAVFISFSFHWPTWTLFIAWLSYYIFGKSLKSAFYTLIQDRCTVQPIKNRSKIHYNYFLFNYLSVIFKV